MPLVDGRSIALPYGIKIRDRNVRVFNREYGVLAGFSLRRRPTHSALAAMSPDGDVRTADGATKVFFYNDACIPFQEAAADTEAYVERLGRFGRLKAAELPRPWPNHTLKPSG